MESIIIYYDLFLSKYLMNTVRQISGSSLLINTDRFSKKITGKFISNNCNETNR